MEQPSKMLYIGYVTTLPNGYDIYAASFESDVWVFTSTVRDRPIDWGDATWWTRDFAIHEGWITEDKYAPTTRR